MFCPECRSEYQEGFTECAFCHVPLVEQLQEHSERTSWDAESDEDKRIEAAVDEVCIAPPVDSGAADEPVDHLRTGDRAFDR